MQDCNSSSGVSDAKPWIFSLYCDLSQLLKSDPGGMSSRRQEGVRMTRREQGTKRRCKIWSFPTVGKHVNKNEERRHLSIDLNRRLERVFLTVKKDEEHLYKVILNTVSADRLVLLYLCYSIKPC